MDNALIKIFAGDVIAREGFSFKIVDLHNLFYDKATPTMCPFELELMRLSNAASTQRERYAYEALFWAYGDGIENGYSRTTAAGRIHMYYECIGELDFFSGVEREHNA